MNRTVAHLQRPLGHLPIANTDLTQFCALSLGALLITIWIIHVVGWRNIYTAVVTSMNLGGFSPITNPCHWPPTRFGMQGFPGEAILGQDTYCPVPRLSPAQGDFKHGNVLLYAVLT